jgi:hypothetical protein
VIGVVVPAHNEGQTIAETLACLAAAAAHAALVAEPVEIMVVLDACDDATGAIAQRSGARTLAVQARNVGVARHLGAEALMMRGARWLAFTDADTCVPPDWLAAQLAHDADAFCGTVEVQDWTAHGLNAHGLAQHFSNFYLPVPGHRRIHGANLGVRADAYRRAGGFPPLACSEDVALVHALEACGARIAWASHPRVITSARTDARARGGFGDTLLEMVAAHIAPLVPAPGGG